MCATSEQLEKIGVASCAKHTTRTITERKWPQQWASDHTQEAARVVWTVKDTLHRPMHLPFGVMFMFELRECVCVCDTRKETQQGRMRSWNKIGYTCAAAIATPPTPTMHMKTCRNNNLTKQVFPVGLVGFAHDGHR